MSDSPSHEVKRPVAQLYNPSFGDKAPLGALLSALTKAPNHMSQVTGMENHSEGAAAFTARLYSALSLQRDSLLSNIQHSKSAQDESVDHQRQSNSVEHVPAEQSSSQGPTISPKTRNRENGEARAIEGRATDLEPTSMEINLLPNPLDERAHQTGSEEARKRRRQEINRESARRVRKRKSEAQVQLQEEVIALKSAATSSAADQAVIVRYASELTKERDALLQRAATLENKWIAAECRNVILRQKIADLTGSTLQQVAPDTGQLISHQTMSEQKTGETAPESSTQFNSFVNKPVQEGLPDHSK